MCDQVFEKKNKLFLGWKKSDIFKWKHVVTKLSFMMKGVGQENVIELKHTLKGWESAKQVNPKYF